MSFQKIVSDLLEHMTQKELAEAAHTTQPTIHRLLKGKTKIPVHGVAKRLEALHLMTTEKKAAKAA